MNIRFTCFAEEMSGYEVATDKGFSEANKNKSEGAAPERGWLEPILLYIFGIIQALALACSLFGTTVSENRRTLRSLSYNS